MINLDETKALEKIADALEKIAHMKEQEPVAILRAGKEPGEFEALPVGGVPNLLIVEVLCALIRLVRAWRNSKADKEILARQLARLEPYLPVRPQVCLDENKEADR